MNCANCGKEIYFSGNKLKWYHVGYGGFLYCDYPKNGDRVAEPKDDLIILDEVLRNETKTSD